MADDYDDTDQTDLVPRAQIRALEEKAKRTGELETRLAEMERRAAFSEAGISMGDPKAKYFVAAYDGELTVEAIRAEALEAGVLTPPQPQATDGTEPGGPSTGELAAHARMQAASEGADGNKPIDLIEAFGKRGTHKPEEIMRMARAAGLRLAEDYQ